VQLGVEAHELATELEKLEVEVRTLRLRYAFDAAEAETLHVTTPVAKVVRMGSRGRAPALEPVAEEEPMDGVVIAMEG